jgi:antitoxin (DNA-binding transcriptional repressor) of toxin-antitoxin stability system
MKARSARINRFSITEAREKLTRLDRILRPGEVVEISRRGRPFARLELLPPPDPAREIMEIIGSLPSGKGKKKRVAARYKDLLYGKTGK